MNLRPIGAPISHFLAWMHNHFCVKLSSLSCNRQKKMLVENSLLCVCFFFLLYYLEFFVIFCVLMSCGDFLCAWCVFMQYINVQTQDNGNEWAAFIALRSINGSHSAVQGIIVMFNQTFHRHVQILIQMDSQLSSYEKDKLEHRIPCAAVSLPPLSLLVMTAGDSWRPAPLQRKLISRFSPVTAATRWAQARSHRWRRKQNNHTFFLLVSHIFASSTTLFISTVCSFKWPAP